MNEDYLVTGFIPPPHPKGTILSGKLVRLEPLDIERHSADLHAANCTVSESNNWRYLPYGPYNTLYEYQEWMTKEALKDDPTFFSIVRVSDQKSVGIASFLRINRKHGTIEVGHINFSPLLQGTLAGTEAMYLMMKWAFENGYRRYEWKCNALNSKSRRAAQRLGLSYEGIFRQMSISKGRNRNTAWFAAIETEWPALEKCFQQYFSENNLDKDNKPIVPLSKLTRPLLYKIDTFEFG